MRRSRVVPALGALLAAGAIVAGCGSSSSNTSGSASSNTSSSASASATKSTGKPILIGAAVDLSSTMKAFDGPALAAAQLEVKKVNAAGGVDGRKLVFAVENDQLKPAQTRSDALDLVSKGADILWVTCDVDFATPSTTVGISSKLLTVSPCTSTDQMGPKRFGPAGQLAFTFGSIAQDEGAALAEFAIKKGWKTAVVVTDKAIAYTVDDAQAFTQRFTQLGGKVVAQESFTQGDKTVGTVASKVASQKAQVIDLSEFWSPAGDLPAFLSDVRTTGDTTPIVGPWSIDGTFWLPSNPKISTNIWHTAYSSVYGDDPDANVQALAQQLAAEGQKPATGGFVLGAAAIDGIVQAIKQAGGSTDGAKLASIMESYKDVPLLGGPVTFTSQVHGVTGRPWRMIEVMNGKPKFLEMFKASSPAGT
jgi:branched-chain amino acid transport system substrate-binding protein